MPPGTNLKLDKQAAKRVFKASVKTDKAFDDILEARKRYLASRRYQQGYILKSYKWIREWRDWLTFEESKAANGKASIGSVLREDEEKTSGGSSLTPF